MPQARDHALPGATNDTWRTWLMTGVRRAPVDRRRLRGEHLGLKRMLVEGKKHRIDQPYTWKEFSDAMVRQAVGEAILALPDEESHLIKLAYFGGLSNHQIAGRVGMTEATVQRRLRRALDAVSEYVQHGRAAARRVAFGLLALLSGRWISEGAHQAAQALAVAGVAVVVAAQPAPAAHSSGAAPPANAAAASRPAAAPSHLAAPGVQAPAPPAEVHLPAVPALPATQPPAGVQLPAVPAPPPVQVNPPQVNPPQVNPPQVNPPQINPPQVKPPQI